MSEMFEAAGKRYRVLVMGGDALFGYLKALDGRAAYRMYGMPEDVKYVGVAAGRGNGKVAFLLESSEWDPLPTNASEIPEIKFEILQALMPNRLEKPEAMRSKLQPIEGGKN